MAESKNIKSRSLPEKINVFVINEDGSISDGAGCMPTVFIEEQAAGRIYEMDVAKYILKNYGRVVGVMRDSAFHTTPQEYKTRKMILGKLDLP